MPEVVSAPLWNPLLPSILFLSEHLGFFPLGLSLVGTISTEGFPKGSVVKIYLPMQKPLETWVWSLHWEDSLEEKMATHSSILAWRTPWTEEPCGLQSMGSQSQTLLNWPSAHARILPEDSGYVWSFLALPHYSIYLQTRFIYRTVHKSCRNIAASQWLSWIEIFKIPCS